MRRELEEYEGELLLSQQCFHEREAWMLTNGSFFMKCSFMVENRRILIKSSLLVAPCCTDTVACGDLSAKELCCRETGESDHYRFTLSLTMDWCLIVQH